MSELLQIYFSSAVRGGASFATLASRIERLSALGHVLTEHMASPRTVDLGHRDDAAIHAHDQALLAKAHVFIADMTQPSTGSGYMAAKAIARGLPALCLYEKGAKASAMIAGSPDITTRFFADEAELMAHVRAFLLVHAERLFARDVATRAPKIFLAGPPGSGKGTLGAKLSSVTGAPHISSGELLRQLVANDPTHPNAVTIASYMNAGKLVPADVMRDIVVDRLSQADCRLFGFILDGYPPSVADLENLRERAIAPDIVFYFDVSDDTSAARQVSRAARSTDTPEKARSRLTAFHEADAGFDALATRWYPNALVVRVDAEQSALAVEAMVTETLRNVFGRATHERSYFPIPPAKPQDARSTRLHFHVDARDVHEIRAIARAILTRHKAAQGRIKIYPIQSLHLASQTKAMPIYRHLPNFHPIENADHEAFITGRLGDGDGALMDVVLDVVRSRGGGIMSELEEYVGEWTLKPDGTLVTDAQYELTPDDHRHAAFDANRAPEIPTWELHHGFDVPKADADAMPITLADLAKACQEAGLDNGGWFIFKNEKHWAYRSNEFSNASHDEAQAKVTEQARALQRVLAERGIVCDVGFSLEKVHGIWNF
jgi:adenylate kinase